MHRPDDSLEPVAMNTPVSHEVPDYPVMNLEAAQRGWERHRECGDGCPAKSYFTKLVARLEGSQAPSTTWNIWRTTD